VDELAFHVRPAECDVGEAPMPDKNSVAGEFFALLRIVTLPFIGPFTVGANVTVRVADWFGVKVRPELTPLGVNADPATLTLEMLMFVFPLFVTVVASELLVVKSTIPKGKLLGFAPSRAVAAVPVPLNGIARGELGASLTSETDPLTAPAVVGAKAMLNDVLPPAAIVVGKGRPVVLKPAPNTLACVIVKPAVPLFVSLIVCELMLPVITLPKLALDGFAVSCCCRVPLPVREIVKGVFAASLATVSVPVTAPVDGGANRT
jgi:hypothetical protein